MSIVRAVDVGTMVADDQGAAADNIAAVNAAIAIGLSQNWPVELPSGEGGTYYYTQDGANPWGINCDGGVNIYGEGRMGATWAPVDGLDDTIDFMRIRPLGNSNFHGINNIMVRQDKSGTPYGGAAFRLVYDDVASSQNWKFSRLYASAGLDYSFDSFNDAAINAQGVPFTGSLEDSYFGEGVKMVGFSDSMKFDHLTIRTTPGSGRVGLDIDPVTGAACTSVLDCNIDASGGAINVRSGSNVNIERADIEQSTGAGSNGAVVNFSGSTAQVKSSGITKSKIGIFQGAGLPTNTVASSVRFGNTRSCFDDRTKHLPGMTVARVYDVTSSALHTSLRPSEIALGAGRFTTLANDLGVGTRGIEIPLTPVSPLTNVGSGWRELGMIKDPLTGRVDLFGWIQGIFSTSPQTLVTLPVGFRPLKSERYYFSANFAGSIVIGVLQILSNGTVQLGGNTSGTVPGQWSLTGISFYTSTCVTDATD